MGSLSEHFDNAMFACKCGKCRQELKVSLTLVGILEDVVAKFNQPLIIRRGFVCDQIELEEPGPKRNYHGIGKAVDFAPQDAQLLPEIFRYLETFPEISGLGYDPDSGYIHVDLREKEPVKWIYQRNLEKELTAELRAHYGLGADVAADRCRKSVSLEMPLEVKLEG
ncbi:putative peptidase M15 [Candidatus Termititenax persephonae]|uniref:Peptidase M15 n=1 Tax=Candidatus Termititenax persephonae TaxID=2218525 RepID=A0A388TGF1_9BACT|nr:putative peptidase M15 [Candidatus Termititenax persephonae]